MFNLRFGSSHVSIFNCIYKIVERKVKFNVELTGAAQLYRTVSSDRKKTRLTNQLNITQIATTMVLKMMRPTKRNEAKWQDEMGGVDTKNQ